MMVLPKIIHDKEAKFFIHIVDSDCKVLSSWGSLIARVASRMTISGIVTFSTLTFFYRTGVRFLDANHLLQAPSFPA